MASSNSILFYDLTRNAEGPARGAHSYNTLRTRLALNIKGIAYETVWITIADVESEAIKAGAQPTTERAGKPLYTVPFIVDPSTGRVVSDSPKIAVYLDEQYPDTPALGPSGSEAEKRTLERAERVFGSLRAVCLSRMWDTLPLRTQAYFHKLFGEEKVVQMITFVPEALPGSIDAALQALAEIEGEMGANSFLGGEKPCWADTFLTGVLWSLRIVLGNEDGTWKALVEARSGRWGAYMQEFEQRGWLKVL
ncbi:hypothetical protein K488DRAFT_85044 [Vararia minispora EC-137]|uniref:Uncharacterized protein n=1 Tax=Vararia minispora EC-137 TaxID=1314806 RepID=A0ACB8QPH3_9AGAM|nr:hypothetical protein K488DRAFT_85044 [Vararia minispora EC-137]